MAGESSNGTAEGGLCGEHLRLQLPRGHAREGSLNTPIQKRIKRKNIEENDGEYGEILLKIKLVNNASVNDEAMIR